MLHYDSHVDVKYKKSLVLTMLNLAFHLSSSWKVFTEECERLKKTLPVHTSRKIAADFPAAETKPPLVNQQCVVYLFKCDLCDADYVGYTCRHLHQRIDEHKSSVVGEHMVEQHGEDAKNIKKNLKVLRKCRGKFECLLYEMLFIKDLKPSLNKQSDSIRSKLFT